MKPLKCKVAVVVDQATCLILFFRFELDLNENEENEENVVASLDKQMQEMYGKILMAW